MQSHYRRALTVGILSCCSVFAQASFHFMQIEQVVGGIGGDTSAQAIQLRMRTGAQNLVSNARIYAVDAAGLNPILIIDMTTNVANALGGDRVLITSTGFNANCTPTCVPDFTMTNLIPTSYLAAGSLRFEDDFNTIYWRLSWGGASYTGPNTGSITNDANGDFGPPFAGPCPSTTNQSLRFQGAFNALSTTNAADYALSTGAAVMTNNARSSFTVKVGACCLPNGSCQDYVRAAACTAGGGAFQGNDTLCSGVTCTQPMGACCLNTGACNEPVTFAACAAAGGAFQGSGSTCLTSNCVAIGACCLPNGSCTPNVSAAACGGQGGSFQGGGSACGSVNCPILTGACCSNGNCADMLENDCTIAGGDFQGTGSTCTPNPCPQPPTGACCFQGDGCDIHTAADCAGHGGAYQGDGSLCEQVVCACIHGDANCDGVVNNFDIDPFVFGLLDQNANYLATGASQACYDQRSCWGDSNCDAAFNNFDIDSFVNCIISPPNPGQGCICPG